MAVNSEAIYGTRPWKIFGSGPATSVAPSTGGNEHHQAGAFNERNRKSLTAQDIRFTKKGSALYAFFMGWPEKPAVVAELVSAGALAVGKIQNVQLLGFAGKLKWSQGADGLRVEMPESRPSDHAIALKIIGA